MFQDFQSSFSFFLEVWDGPQKTRAYLTKCRWLH